MPALPFPRSSTPGVRPGEGEGRLVNCRAEKQGDTDVVRRLAGLTSVVDTGQTGPRGMIDMPDGLYAAFSGVVVRIIGTVVTALSGALPGTDAVTFARNNKVPTPELVAVRQTGGAYLVTSSAVSAFPDSDLPASVHSADFLDGFTLFTTPDARIFASGLNAETIDALSFATAEASPDGLVRGVVKGNKFYACGPETIEPWVNNGLSPFPLLRSPTVIRGGLLSAGAIAGHERGYGGPLVFVASDGTVRTLEGLETRKVSTSAVERFIATSTAATIDAFAYSAAGRSFVAITSDQGTWEIDLGTGQWHERASTGATGWRGKRSVYSGGRWLVGDRLSGRLLAVDDTVRTENGAAMPWTVESGPLKGFPARVAVPSLMADITKAAGASVSLSVSHDGGAFWSTPLERALDPADRHPVRWNRLGLTTHHGLRARFTGSGAADLSFLGASVPDPEARRP